MNTLYHHDFYAWANEQAALLRAGRLSEADIGNIAAEIEGVARGEKRELVNRLKILLLHLLEWRFQPNRQSRSWQGSIKLQRLEITDHLADNPSLKPQLAELIGQAYRLAAVAAATETGLDETMFPDHCPWTQDQLFDPGFLPHAST